ncbi:MAG: hypothetical protein MR272_09515, partial [Pseudoflavonifractor sp.]|nr:hypothetical protein [Pseudoflavonifractor sp.]
MEQLIFYLIFLGVALLFKKIKDGPKEEPEKKILSSGTKGEKRVKHTQGDFTDRRKAESTGIGDSVAAVGDKIFDFFSGDKEDTEDTFSWKASDPTPTSYGSSGAVSHDHIPSTALDTEKRLEQLKRMLDAGLIDKDEYR